MSWRNGFGAALAAGLALMIGFGTAAQEGKPAKKGGKGMIRPSEEVLKKREARMKELEKTISKKLNIPPTDGMFLKIMAASTRAQKVLEIGSSNGYSACWIGQGLEQTGGHLWTIEIDAARAAECRDNLKECGLDNVVTSIEGNAFKEIPRLEGPFDMVFLDAWKTDYKRFLELFLPMVRPGGIIIAHNTIEQAKDMPDYLEAVFQSPDLDSVTLSTTQWKKGITITYKRRL